MNWKKAKRIIALIGALILIGLYLAVLILGIVPCLPDGRIDYLRRMRIRQGREGSVCLI